MGFFERTNRSADFPASSVPVISPTFNISAPVFVAATIVSIIENPAFSTKEIISPMAVVPYGVRLEQKESDPIVRPIPFAAALRRLSYTLFNSFSATVAPSYLSCTSGIYGGS